MTINEQIQGIKGLDPIALKLAQDRQNSLLKPKGSLGKLEDLSVQIAGITGKIKNHADKKLLVLFGADNGIYEEGIAATPQHFTRTLMLQYADQKKCAINVLCDHCGVTLKLVDVGVIGDTIHPFIDQKKQMQDGTRNFSKESAMEMDTVLQSIKIGAEYAAYAKKNGFEIVGNGEVGMGNTTTATACILAACGMTNASAATGRGAGLTDAAFAKKKRVIEEALNRYQLDSHDPIAILSCVGGLDIAAMVGLYLGCAYQRIPIVIDGVISMAAALLAYRLNPLTKEFMIASHLSEEPAYRIAINEMNLSPMLSLQMRLGEGSGCPLTMQVIETALAVMNDMATFEESQMETNYREEIKMSD